MKIVPKDEAGKFYEQHTEIIDNEPVEVVDEVTYISGEYLSAAMAMAAWQFLDRPKEDLPTNFNDFAEQCVRIVRQHTPIVYAYFFNNHVGDWALPTGTIAIICDNIRKNGMPEFLGGGLHGDIEITE